MAVLVEQARAVEIQAVAFLAGFDTLDAPLPQRPEAALVPARRVEHREEARQGALARYPLDAGDGGHHRIAPQIGHMGEFFRTAEQSLNEGHRLVDGLDGVVALRQAVRQQLPESADKAAGMQEPPEHRAARVRAEFPVGKADGDGLAAILDHHCFVHRWVNRRVTWLFVFFHTHIVPSPAVDRQFSFA